MLISGAGTGTAFALASRLRASWGYSVRLVTADTNPLHLVSASILSDAFYRVPRADEPAFADAIIDIIGSESVDSYVPLLNVEIEVASRLAGELGAVDVWSSPLAARLSRNKLACAAWLATIDVPVPRCFPEDAADPAALYFIKPVDGFGSRNAGMILGADLASLPDEERAALIVQEVCSQPEITVDSFFDCDRQIGRSVMRERLETKAGVCTKARVFEDSEIDALARRIAEASMQKGTICFQVMRVADGWAVTDLNFRPGAGTAMSCAAGVDLLSAAFACRWGQDYERYLEPRLPEEGIFVTRQYAEFVMPSP